MITGATMIFGNYTNEVDMIRALEKYQVNIFTLVPPRLLLLADTLRRMSPRPALESLRLVVNVGGVLSAAAQLRVSELLGAAVLQRYGCTENPRVTTDTVPSRPGSSGKPMSGVLLRIVDVKTGEDITTPGVAGEVRFKTPGTTHRYLGNPEGSQSAYDDRGYYCSGDLGYLDEDGYLFIIERIEELLKYDNVEIAPAELEAVLQTHPEVSEVCVVGRPHPQLGDFPTAFVVRGPGSGVTDTELQDLVAGRLSDLKKLRGGVYFVDQIPKHLNGKFDKNSLRKKLKEELLSNDTSSSVGICFKD